MSEDAGGVVYQGRIKDEVGVVDLFYGAALWRLHCPPPPTQNRPLQNNHMSDRPQVATSHWGEWSTNALARRYGPARSLLSGYTTAIGRVPSENTRPNVGIAGQLQGVNMPDQSSLSRDTNLDRGRS